MIRYLNLKISKIILEEVEKKAKSEKIPVVISIVNSWGYPIAIHFMDGALPASYDISLSKAFTAATVRMSTKELKDLSCDRGELYGINNTNNNKIVVFPGGYPLKNYEGIVVGGIGVSGSTAYYDDYLADYGRKLYEEVARCLEKKQ
ncbi:GlcG/HbpS family heme-binding protein [Clostridium fallax]|uniref:Uncharacterized conserved protein GlcG, DUF336 family n=1 Tax=Clostridium fallax TaxID=1533 RepID=A0A1M4XCL8_9CLOT|nr:heme-binding protein [Clostridium fallax]SHE90972.1 Uncharacterized conserved protein GlcG, DUF336 family [Clostridium fallax]SQB05988.1 DhaG protein [Clostridium fallax]